MDWREQLAQRETSTHFIVEGRNAVDRLLKSNYRVTKVVEIGQDLDRSEASALLGFHFHRSHLAIAEKPRQVEIEEFGCGTLLVLPEIADPGNLGTLIRNTAAFGGAGVILGKGASPFNAKAVRASAGTLFRVPIRRSPDLLDDLKNIKKNRVLVGASLREGSKPLPPSPISDQQIALLLGAEDFGLPPEIDSLCDYRFHLPMSAGIDSLNVGSAGAIFLHSFRRKN